MTLLLLLVTLGAAFPAAAQPQSVPRTLSLDQAVEIALRSHAGVEDAEAGVEARAGALRQAALSPNPIFSVQTENWRFSGTPGFTPGRDLDIFVFATQKFETGGKKKRRVETAEAQSRIAELERERVKWRIRQRVKRAYWQALAAERRVELLSESVRNSQELVRYHRVRFDLGAAAEADLIKVRVEEEKAAMKRANASLEAEQARIALLSAMGLGGGNADFQLVLEPLAEPASTNLAQRPERWLRTALEQRPAVLIQQARVEQALAAVELQKAQSVPDVSPYFGYKRTAGFDTLIGGVSIALPVRDRNQGAIAEARAEAERERARLRAVQAQVRAEVAAAWAALERRADMLAALKTGMVERARETHQIALRAYEQDAAGLLAVLDAQRSRNEAEVLYEQIRFGYQLSRVELETAAGAELPAADSLAAAGGGAR